MPQAGRKVRKLSSHARDNKSVGVGEAKKNSPELNERSGNVFENKGPLWKNGQRSWNVYDNKCT
jgi:hypothetical protein